MKPTISRLRHTVGALSFALSISAVNAQISYTATFDQHLLTTDTVSENGDSYLRLRYPDLWTQSTAGTPELPVHYLRFSVPCDATDFTVSVTGETTTAARYTLPVYPTQPPIPSNRNTSEQPFVSPDSTVYSNNRYWPAVPVQVVDEGFLDGDNHIVTVAVWPISYAPTDGEILFRNSVSVRLDYSVKNAGSENPSRLRAISRRTTGRNNVRWGKEEAKRIVVNPAQVDGFAPATATRSASSRTVTTLPDFEYTVVTSRELAPAFDRLIGWKRQKGYSAGVVCIEDILACPDFQGGDLVSNIDDDAGKLRAYLKYAYDSGSLRYALLAGDYTVLPIRYGCGDHNYSSTKIVSNNSKIPTDIYFSDFNGNWNKDGDDHYGESTHDKVDFYPEIFVGRLLCTSRQEIANYTEKLIRYERNPGNGDYSYLQKAFYCQSDQMQRDNEAGIIKSAWGTTFYQDTVIEEFPSYETQSVTKPTGADVIREMNNRYGFFSWHGHGAPAGITVRSRGVNDWDNYAIVPFDGVLDKDSVHYSMNVEVGHGLDNLTNQDYPAIAYSIACDVTPFDIFERYDIKYNIGSSFTVAGLYGGPAFLGNTRVGWIGPSVRLEKLFVEQIKSNSYQLGVAEALSKATFNDDWCKQTHSLIGCPEFEMWTDIPSVYKGVTVWRRDNSIVVRGRLEGSKVAITSGSNGLPEVKDLTKTSVTFNGVSPNSVVTVYKHNAIPYIATLYLQNDTLRSSQYLHVNNVHIGKAVDTNRTEGDVVLKSGTLTLESGGDVWIDEGVIIENGATLIIECKGNVTISGGTVERGGSLRIDARGEIMIQKGFEAKIGANIEFK